MRSIFRGNNRTKAQRVDITGTTTQPSQKSLGLRALLPEAEGASVRVLDLGPARSANLEFFARYGGQLTVADFYRGLRQARASVTGDDDERKRKAVSALLEYDETTRFDLVLAWDLLNYLTPGEQNMLMATLEPFCMPGTHVLAFVSTQKEMPPAPSTYSIVDSETLACEAREGRARPCPRYLEGDLLKRMQGLSVENRYQLRNGMLEYVFSYRLSSRPGAASPSDSLRYRLRPARRWSSAPSR